MAAGEGRDGLSADGGAMEGLSTAAIGPCAALVERGDGDRFAAVMAAPVAARGPLLVLYAFNLEVARAPWVTQEPMIAEMRLQWWRDVVAEAGEGRPARAHEVAGPLAALIRGAALPVAVLDGLIEARRWDVYREPFGDAAQFACYLEDTAGGLMTLAGRALGADQAAESLGKIGAAQACPGGVLALVPGARLAGRVSDHATSARPARISGTDSHCPMESPVRMVNSVNCASGWRKNSTTKRANEITTVNVPTRTPVRKRARVSQNRHSITIITSKPSPSA